MNLSFCFNTNSIKGVFVPKIWFKILNSYAQKQIKKKYFLNPNI